MRRTAELFSLFTFTFCFLIASLSTTPASAESAEIDCKAAYEDHLKTDMSLTYEEFDQTMNSGFRVLAQAACYAEAADLIEAYIEKNQATQSSLRWHVAQLRATTGDNEAAVASARTVLSEKEDFSKSPLRWNDYVLATIAFLEGDKETLIKHRDNVVAAEEEHFGNEMNGKLLDALVRNFGKSYAEASSDIEP